MYFNEYHRLTLIKPAEKHSDNPKACEWYHNPFSFFIFPFYHVIMYHRTLHGTAIISSNFEQ